MPTFDEIFRKYYHSLLIYGLKFLSDENDVYDILQEIFTSVWKSGKYTLADEHLKSYLFSSVRNGCMNHLRHQSVIRNHAANEKSSFQYNELAHYQNGEKTLIEKEDLGKIYLAIDSLADNYKEVIRLSRFEGKKNKEIAELLNIPIRTVETRLFRALSKLRNILTGKQIYILFSFTHQHSPN